MFTAVMLTPFVPIANNHTPVHVNQDNSGNGRSCPLSKKSSMVISTCACFLWIWGRGNLFCSCERDGHACRLTEG